MKPSNLSRIPVIVACLLLFALSATLAGAQPANDNFQNAVVITGARGFVSGTNASATLQAGEPDHADERGGASVWWRWTAPEDGMVIFHTFGSDFDTLLAVYTGDSVDGLDIIAASDDDGPGGESMVIIEVMAGTTYHIAVDGYYRGNGLGATTGTVTLHWSDPLANDNLSAATVITGASGVTAGWNEEAGKETGEPDHAANVGGASLWWQWTAPENSVVAFHTFGSEFDTLLAVYTGDNIGSLTLLAANDDAGPDGQSMVRFTAAAGATYHIAVDGYADIEGLEPETGTVVLHWGAPLANDDFSNASLLTGASGTVTVRNEGATKEAGEPDHAEDLGGASVWWQWSAAENAVVTFDTFGSELDTLLAVYTGGSVGALTLVAANDEFGDFSQSLLSFTAVAGTSYWIAVDGNESMMGRVVLNWGPPVVNDDFSRATVITSLSGSASGRNVGATMEADEPDHAGESGGASVWWQWTAPAGGAVVFDTFGSDFDTVLAVYTGSSLTNLLLVADNDDDGENMVSRVSFVAVAGTTYQIAVDGYEGEIGTVLLHWGPPAASFVTWAAGFGLSGDAAAPDADSDSDGLPNAVEYVLGGNPANPASPSRPAATVSGGNRIFSFARDDASETTDVTLTVEAGTDLINWPVVFNIGPNTDASSPGVIITENGAAPDLISVVLPQSTGTAEFARLKVTIAP